MTRKNIGWVALGTFAFAVLIGAICGRQTPQSADASPSSPQLPPNNTQTCQVVIQQINTIQQTVMSQKHSGSLVATPFDAVVARESQIDTSQCPADFRSAMTHFVAAETIASFNARMDPTGELDRALSAIMETSATYGFAAPRASLRGTPTAKAYLTTRNRISRTSNRRWLIWRMLPASMARNEFARTGRFYSASNTFCT